MNKDTKLIYEAYTKNYHIYGVEVIGSNTLDKNLDESWKRIFKVKSTMDEEEFWNAVCHWNDLNFEKYQVDLDLRVDEDDMNTENEIPLNNIDELFLQIIAACHNITLDEYKQILQKVHKPEDREEAADLLNI